MDMNRFLWFIFLALTNLFTPYLLLIICSVLPDVRCKLISAVVAHELLEVI